MNQAVVAVGFGILTGFIVIFTFVLVQYLKRRYSSDKNTSKASDLNGDAFSDPRVRSRTIIQQDVPVFHLPTIVPFSIQQSVCSKQRSDTGISYLNWDGYQVIPQQAENENLVRSRQGTLSLEDINTVSPSPALPKKKLSSDSSHSDGSLVPTTSPAEAKRKMAIPARKHSVNLGRLEFSLYYDQASRLLQIYVNRGYEMRGVAGAMEALPDALVTASLSLNDLKVVWEDKTKTVIQSINPLFNQKLSEARDIDAADMQDLILRFQVLDDHASVIIGEVTHALEGLAPNKLHTVCKPLQALQLRTSDNEELISIWEPPRLGELLVALCHNPTDHKLLVKVQEARDLVFSRRSGKPDPYVKVDVLFCGKKLFSKSTKVIHKTVNPVFDETFVFDINAEKLPQVALVLKVKHHGIVRGPGIGVLHLGYCVNVESQYKHWEQVMQKPHLEIAQWHRIHDYATAGDF